jgi:hypothetical protein
MKKAKELTQKYPPAFLAEEIFAGERRFAASLPCAIAMLFLYFIYPERTKNLKAQK